MDKVSPLQGLKVSPFNGPKVSPFNGPKVSPFNGLVKSHHSMDSKFHHYIDSMSHHSMKLKVSPFNGQSLYNNVQVEDDVRDVGVLVHCVVVQHHTALHCPTPTVHLKQRMDNDTVLIGSHERKKKTTIKVEG
ncbi:hypothetical protein BgiBS90_010467 [Biomphalaria glabrata]|nr:hypothetical protein BgiBS90_010467 [Biomphalaria glabrata]